MLTRKGLAEHFKVTERTIDRYRKAGMPYVVTITGLVRFDLDEVTKWLLTKVEKENK